MFDEPSSNLDHAACTQLATLMKRLKEQGKTLVIAEHRLHYLSELFDRVIYLNHGEITHDWSRKAFLALTDTERQGMGLRAIRLNALAPENAALALPAMLNINAVTARYNRKAEVLQDISFTASPSEIIGIMGKNGQGKSTLARVLCGIHKERSGTFTLYAKRMKPKARAGPCYLVMQESGYQLFTDSVENELRLSKSKKHRPSPEKIDAILEALNLTALRERHPMSLSGGEKQRTAIGTAMAHDAQVVIFDEPTSGLDFANMRRVVDVLKQLADSGKIIFVITHDFELLARACTRTILLEEGKIKSDLPLNTKNLSIIKEFFL